MADSSLQTTIKAQRMMGMKGANWDNHAIARYTLFQEIGLEGERPSNPYDFDEFTRDTLLAHARQDAAHTVCNTKSLLDLNGKISRQLTFLNVLLLVSVCFLGTIVVKLYPQLLPGLH